MELPIGEKEDISMMWETGVAYNNPAMALHCSYDNSTCYQAKSVPVIYETSSSIGYTTGGMNLTIKGFGFIKGVINAKVDGQDCVVTSRYEDSFSFEVQSKESVSNLSTSYVGCQGIRRHYISGQNWLNWAKLPNYRHTAKLATSLETEYAKGDKLGNIFKGWFKAPATTRYRFYQSCDDYCLMYLGNTSMQT